MRCLPLTVLALAPSACGTEPKVAPASGQWGSPDVGFDVRALGATLRLPCDAQTHFVGPIVPDASGRFEVAGALARRYAAAQVHVTGVLSDGKLGLTLRFRYDDGGSETRTALLLKGVQPDFSQAVCFA